MSINGKLLIQSLLLPKLWSQIETVNVFKSSSKADYLYHSRVAQWKRAGPITQRSVDRKHALLIILFLQKIVSIFFLSFSA